MISGFLVFHKKNPSGSEAIPQGVPLWSFKTCLRHLHFSWVAEGQKLPHQHDFEMLQGQEAYNLSLEILCGLHSPVVGETEVFGQFKSFWQSQEAVYPLKQLFDALVTDVKRIRKDHLIDLGSQSYGSLVRRLLPKKGEIAVIGGGSLAQEILPWVYKEQNDIRLCVRNKKKTEDLRVQFPRIQVDDLKTPIYEEYVIIAAPVSSALVEELVQKPEALIIDLRGESRDDRCTKFSNYKDLKTFFEDVEKNKSQVIVAKNKALKAVEQTSQERFLSENLRPFGWEDICAW